MPDLALVHLVRKANGPEPFREFLESYRAADAGADHDLVLLLKGFDSRARCGRSGRLAGGADAQRLYVDDAASTSARTSRLSTGSSTPASASSTPSRRCVRRAGSGALDAGAAAPGERGIAGATGSWASHLSWLRFNLGLPTPYRTVFPGRAWTQAQVQRLTPDTRRVLAPVWLRHVIGAAVALPLFAGDSGRSPRRTCGRTASSSSAS